MSRDEADELIDAGALTWGALKTMLRCEMGAPPRKSVVNRMGMTHEQAVDILAAGIDRRDDDEIVCAAWPARSVGVRAGYRALAKEKM